MTIISVDLSGLGDVVFSPQVRRSGVEALEAGRVVVGNEPPYWSGLVAGSDGETYSVAAQVGSGRVLESVSCTCRAAAFGRRCYHEAAFALALLERGIVVAVV